MPVKIVIVEDHLMFREVLRKVCAGELRHEVAGEAADGEQAIAMIRLTRPDLVLLDLNLPRRDGFSVIEAVQEFQPAAKFLVLSSHCDEFTVYRVERLGVRGFVDKNTNSVESLKQAVAVVAAGGVSYSEAFLRAKKSRIHDPHSFDKVLTDRERAVLSLIGVPMSDVEIAQRLNISPETASKHRFNLMRKLDVATTLELVRYARDHGFTLSAPRRGDAAMLP